MPEEWAEGAQSDRAAGAEVEPSRGRGVVLGRDVQGQDLVGLLKSNSHQKKNLRIYLFSFSELLE